MDVSVRALIYVALINFAMCDTNNIKLDLLSLRYPRLGFTDCKDENVPALVDIVNISGQSLLNLAGCTLSTRCDSYARFMLSA